MPDVTDLGSALSVLEGILVGDVDLGIPAPSPLLGVGIGLDPATSITIGDGLFLGRPLESSSFLVDKRVVISAPSSVNTERKNTRNSTVAEDLVITDLCVKVPHENNSLDQKAARNGVFKLDNQIRGALSALSVESLGLKFTWTGSTNRIALNEGAAGSAGYGSAKHIVISSTYKMSRIESLTGGPSL